MDATDGPSPPSAVNPQGFAEDLARRNDLSLAYHGRLGTLTDLESQTDALTRTDARLFADAPADPDAEPMVRRLAALLVACDVLPKDPDYPDLRWAWVRCLFAGLGYRTHGLATRLLVATHPTCPFDENETHQEWMRHLFTARTTCGWPASTCRTPWLSISQLLPVVPIDHGAGQHTLWHVALVLCHLARYGRWGSGPAFVLRSQTTDLRYDADSVTVPLTIALVKSAANLSAALGAKKLSKKESHAPTSAVQFVLSRLTIACFEPLIPPSQVPKDWIVGPHPRLVGCATEPGLVPVSLKTDGVWRVRVNTTPGQPTAIAIEPLPVATLALDYDWPAEQRTPAHEVFAASLPTAVSTFELPFDRIVQAFPNLECPVQDQQAYRAIVNSTLIGPYLDDCREYPPVYICPAEQTDEGATNTGKSTLAKALAVSYAPGLAQYGSLKVSSDGAPAARALLALLERFGTACFDEFLLSKDPDHPLSETKILNLATGDSVAFGKVWANQICAARLSAPLFIAAKVVRGKVDMFNRSLRLELGPLTHQMTTSTYTELQSGRWSLLTGLHARVAGRMYQDLVSQVKATLPTPPGHWRFPTLRALASILLSYDENIPVEQAAERIDLAVKAITERHLVALGKAMDSGLSVSAAESGSTLFGVDHLFSEDFCSDAAFLACEALGTQPVREFLKAICDWAKLSPAKLVADVYGAEFTGTERQLVLSLNKSLTARLTRSGDLYRLPGHRGDLGWHIERGADLGTRARFHLVSLTPNQIAQAPVTAMDDSTINPFGSFDVTPANAPKQNPANY
jgi:hypothetical protein